jgi:hypothetical protein
VAKVERDAVLVAIERLEEEGVLLLLEGRDIATDVTAGARILDLDDLCPQVGKLHGRPWAGAELLDRDHSDVLERERHWWKSDIKHHALSSDLADTVA